MQYVIDDGIVSFVAKALFDRPQTIIGADAASFEQIDEWFGRDCRSVYFLFRPIVEADPSTFVYLGGYICQWARDKSAAYYFWPTATARRYKVLKSRSLEDFTVLPGSTFKEYAKDRETVYYMGKRVRRADAATFEVLKSDRMGEAPASPSYHFARDRTNIYFDGKRIEDADYESFRVVHAPGFGNLEYGIDKLAAYHKSPAQWEDRADLA